MHTVVVRRTLLDEEPELVRAVYQALLDAKDAGAARYRVARTLYQVPTMLPWTNALFERNERDLPDDWWPHGIAANRHTLDTFLRYHEQALSARRWSVEELFAHALLDR